MGAIHRGGSLYNAIHMIAMFITREVDQRIQIPWITQKSL